MILNVNAIKLLHGEKYLQLLEATVCNSVFLPTEFNLHMNKNQHVAGGRTMFLLRRCCAKVKLDYNVTITKNESISVVSIETKVVLGLDKCYECTKSCMEIDIGSILNILKRTIFEQYLHEGYRIRTG